MNKVIKFVVEEWESSDGSFSYEFDDISEAFKRADKSLDNPAYGIRRVRLWKCVLLEDNPVSTPNKEKKRAIKKVKK